MCHVLRTLSSSVVGCGCEDKLSSFSEVINFVRLGPFVMSSHFLLILHCAIYPAQCRHFFIMLSKTIQNVQCCHFFIMLSSQLNAVIFFIIIFMQLGVVIPSLYYLPSSVLSFLHYNYNYLASVELLFLHSTTYAALSLSPFVSLSFEYYTHHK